MTLMGYLALNSVFTLAWLAETARLLGISRDFADLSTVVNLVISSVKPSKLAAIKILQKCRFFKFVLKRLKWSLKFINSTLQHYNRQTETKTITSAW